MDESDIPRDVRQLIASSLDSIEHIDMLLLIVSTEPRPWSIDAVAEELRLAPAVVQQCLTDLERAHLVVRISGQNQAEEQYVFAAVSPDVRNAVSWLAETYKLRPSILLRAVYNRSGSIAQTFADAFRLRSSGGS